MLDGCVILVKIKNKGGIAVKTAQPFTGFSAEMIDFLWELRFHNYKAWFDENRTRYQRVLKLPMDAFAQALSEKLAHGTGLKLLPSVSRINRDVRFSKDKSPYRDHKWLVLHRHTGPWKDKPVLYFEVGPDGYCVGLGIYENLPAYLKGFRKKILSDSARFLRIIHRVEKKGFHSEGESYCRKMIDTENPELAQWGQKKEIDVVMRRKVDELLFDPNLLDWCEERMEELWDFYRFLDEVVVE